MIDINLLREDPKKIKKAVADKQLDPALVETALKLDEKWRELVGQVQELRTQRNEAAKNKDIEKGKEVKVKLQEVEPQLAKIEKETKRALLKLPNLPTDDVKVGKNDTENEIVRKWGEPTKFDFEPKAFWELGESLGIIDTERAAKVSGTRFFYLKGDGVLLDQAIVAYALETLAKEGFTPVIPPVLIKKDMMGAMGYLENGGEEDMYVLGEDGLILVGTSEQSIGPMHSGEVLSAKNLPLRYAGYSTCFRREAGSYGKDTRGSLRVHQFNKVEMFSFTKGEDSDKEHEFLLSLEEKFLQALELPYQLIKMCTGDLGSPAARKYDLEAWFPSEGKYRELTSTSNCTDYQSRSLNIKYQDGGETKFVHTLNGTAFSQRPILAILENFQQKDGSVAIPKVLQKWMGKEKIEIKNG